MEEKVARHFFEERTALDPSFVTRDYLNTEQTQLSEEIVECAIKYAGVKKFDLVSIYELQYSQRILACCDMIQRKMSSRLRAKLPPRYGEQWKNFFDGLQISDCRNLSESLKSCLIMNFREDSERLIEQSLKSRSKLDFLVNGEDG
ncbi:hypothetical protein RF11_09931 [Thelohanellus kitauei]|uniref:Uncharacterized protein n=1 Tax=Thelohanellus kitauei TaxID=669202 RepID=A0A0C2IDB8_THEKT|nr:hypothetical protein RF11_15426 [Thelohanellus kitauei]KII72084.1 hypothetical protein RF11_09931 [Thelohanellus kitauei]